MPAIWSTGTALERVQYGFDRDSNHQWRDNLVADGLSANQDEYYTYDGLSRLSSLKRGTLNAGRTGLTTTPIWEEDFNFDPTCNWHGTTTGYKTLVNGATTLDQMLPTFLASYFLPNCRRSVFGELPNWRRVLRPDCRAGVVAL